MLTKRLGNENIEKIVVGIILRDNKLYNKLIDRVTFKDFYTKKCSQIIKIINYLYVNEKPFDTPVVEDFAVKHNLGINSNYLYDCEASVPNMENIDYYIEKVKSYSTNTGTIIVIQGIKP